MANIPIIKTGSIGLDLFMTRLKSELDPVLANKFVQGNFLQNITLVPGVNYVSHTLARMPLGWSIVDITGPYSIWRSAPSTITQLTLTASVSANLSVSLWVF